MGFMIAIAIMFLFCGAGYAQQTSAPKDSGKIETKAGNNRKSIRKGILLAGLTDEQKKNLMEIKKKYSEKQEEIDYDITRTRFFMIDELRKDNPSKHSVLEMVNKLNSLHSQVQIMRIEEFFEVQKILTPNQRKKFTRAFTRGMLYMENKPGHKSSKNSGMKGTPPPPPEGAPEMDMPMMPMDGPPSMD